MPSDLLKGLDLAGFIPHGYCLQWKPALVWMLVASDGIIAVSYFSIPFALWYFARKRSDISHRWLLVLFGLFVMACGSTHLFDVVNVWRPDYWLAAAAGIVTAVLSLTTAIVLWLIMPAALRAPSARQLDLANRKLAESAGYARSLIEASLDPLVTISGEGKILDVNRATEQATGIARERLFGTDFCNYFTAPEQARAGYLEAYAKGQVVDYPLSIRHVSGRVTPVLYNASVYLDQYQRVAGVFAAARDITGLKQVEVQLENANRELESFCYSVSHDLRAPLRGIDGWSLALIEDYGDQLDAAARGYLEIVRSETQRMGQLIDDLLELSRVGRSEVRREPLNLSALADVIVERCRQDQPERPLDVRVQPGLFAWGDARLLEIALTNLFANACKFTMTRPVARIEFGSRTEENPDSNVIETVYFVRDNGVGFDMSYAEKLFAPFQRLHKASEFPGTGIGLATVQRIVHRHRGRIWAEAVPDGGATFYFTLGEAA